MDSVIELFHFPKEAQVNNRIPIKTIIKELGLGKVDEKLLRMHISSINLRMILDSETTLLKSLTVDGLLYEEIQVFLVHLKTNKKIKTLHNKLHMIFPNPTVVCTKYHDVYHISLSDKRINQIDESQSVLEQVYMTDAFKLEDIRDNFSRAIDFRKHQFANLYHVYSHYQNAIYTHILIKILGSYPDKLLSVDFVKNKLNQITKYDAEINILEEKMKSALGMSEKMQHHKEITNKTRQKDLIVKEIMEEINHG